TPRYTLSHDSVYRAVGAGLMKAGGGIGRTLAAVDDETRSLLRVLHTTASYTPHAVAVAPRINEATRLKLQTALTALSDQAILDALKISGFTAADDSDWDDVRALNLRVINAE
ncbi:MAG: phosphate/phosphite/phosphonate ABC transporter substrate-binding protein, partial [Litorivicinus sp.]